MGRHKPIALLIRQVLLDEGEISPYDFWKRFSPDTSYNNVVNYFWILEKLGLIQKTRVEPVNSKGASVLTHEGKVGKVYYSIVPGMEDHPAWFNPRRYYYGPRQKT